jgi:hypothetical protein
MKRARRERKPYAQTSPAASDGRAPTVGFRLSEPYWSQLAERAARAGLSIHGYARLRLMEDLDAQERSLRTDATQRGSEGDVTALREEIQALREALAHSVETLLLNQALGNADEGEEEAVRNEIKRWVDRHVRLRSPIA